MNDWQLFLVLLVPIAFNGLGFTLLDRRISALETRVEHGFEALTGRVNDLADRMARVEERLNIR
jgi:hypothetical protein